MNIRRWALLDACLAQQGANQAETTMALARPCRRLCWQIVSHRYSMRVYSHHAVSWLTHSSSRVVPSLRAALSPDQRGEAEGAHAAGERADVGLHAGVVGVCWCGGGASLLLCSRAAFHRFPHHAHHTHTALLIAAASALGCYAMASATIGALSGNPRVVDLSGAVGAVAIVAAANAIGTVATIGD